MSHAFYQTGGLRFWNEKEINFRKHCISILSQTVSINLKSMNRAWDIVRMEGPILTPREFISPAYDSNDIWTIEDHPFRLRAETTASTYEYARHILKTGTRLPLCIWQAGKSFRRETNDGASPSKLRFLEFWQQEFQCIYSLSTKMDYREGILSALMAQTMALTGIYDGRIVNSDRLPAYSESTKDIEIFSKRHQRYFEVASISIRTDFSVDHKVLEIAFGLDRLVEIRNWTMDELTILSIENNHEKEI